MVSCFVYSAFEEGPSTGITSTWPKPIKNSLYRDPESLLHRYLRNEAEMPYSSRNPNLVARNAKA